ncbi:hypothetical protein E3J62_06615 [candidate division TA06 bacterium]|uniref:HEAT repeat domain-containing protein n=1 Tax=candidate division TA06 bacterium TaxID=2250710 RepID=A0A523UTL1_UNCT6|nr:MAG: hypothetical protein E3J62_06615 [candidate division TA06 bacterium]
MLSDLSKKGANIQRLARKASKNGETLSEVTKGISSDKARVKYGCAKVLRTLSETNPEVLYSSWDFFADMLDTDNTFLKSDAAFIIANLTGVDSKCKFEKLFDKFYGLVDDESMVTAANVVKISGVVAKAKPKLQSRITNRLLSIDKTHHGRECKNIIKGHAILALDEYFDESRDKKKILKFVKKQLRNPRPGTRKKAEKFLKKWDEGRL